VKRLYQDGRDGSPNCLPVEAQASDFYDWDDKDDFKQ
jgi:hypothetical protein